MGECQFTRIEIKMSDSNLMAASRSADTEALYGEFSAQLQNHRELALSNPLSNPISLLGLDVAARLSGEDMKLVDLSALIQNRSSAAFLQRAKRLGDYLGEMSIHRNTSRMEALFGRIAQRCESFEAFEKELSREWLGVVMTAHPTFGLSDTLYDALAGLALDDAEGGSELDEEDRSSLHDLVAGEIHAPDDLVDCNRRRCCRLRWR